MSGLWLLWIILQGCYRGQNVCLYYLLSSCKFGDHKCIYSHSKAALPSAHGWWNDPEQIKRVKEVLEFAEKKAREKRTRGRHRTDAKKQRAKGHGRGKGQHVASKHKERNGREKAKDGKPDAKDVETPAVDKHAKEHGNGEVDAEEGGIAKQKAAPADVSNDKAGSTTEEREPIGADAETEAVKVNAEPSASWWTDSTSKQVSSTEITDLKPSDTAVQVAKSDNKTIPVCFHTFRFESILKMFVAIRLFRTYPLINTLWRFLDSFEF